MLSDPLVLAAACLAVIIIGLAKGGFSGIGALATPVLAMVMPPVQAAAVLLPMLIVQDVVSVWAFRKTWNRRIVAIMLPGALAGIALGWAFAEILPVAGMMAMLGLISMMFGVWRLWVERGGRIVAAAHAPDWAGVLAGVAAGFTSQVAHAGGPPFQIYVAPKKLPHEEFVGTTSVLFAIINWAKVPAYIALGEFTTENLGISAMLVPLAIVSTAAGVWLIRRLDAPRFYTIVYLLMIGLGLKLIVDAF
ncbi:MAG: sulfite exporter TauE/SafE family protein [Sphingobium phenoxybenzoativorans]